MSPQSPNKLYPEVIQSNPDSSSPFLSNPRPSSSSSSSSLYPSIDMKDLERDSIVVESSEEIVVRIAGAIVHLIDRQQSVELACGELRIVRLRQGENVIAVLARVGEEIQWPLAKDEAAVKLDDSHYFFSLRLPPEEDKGAGKGSASPELEELLNYGVTIASKGQENQLKQLDRVLGEYSAFSVKEVAAAVEGGLAAKEVSPEEMENKKEAVEVTSAAYWTTLAPNVEDYSGSAARMIAAGSGQLIKGILWCGDVTADRLRWGNEFLKKRIGSGPNSEISPQALGRMKSVKKLTKMSEDVATGILSGVVRVSGFFTSSIVNSKVGKKFFDLLPGEIVLASLDGFNKVWDAVEVAGKNVMSTTSVVTTGLVSQRFGEQAAEVTNDGLDAAGHAIGTAWAVFKIRKALNPKSVIKPTTLVKAAAANAKLKSQ